MIATTPNPTIKESPEHSLKSWLRPGTAPSVEITDNDTLLFTSGACHILAREINKLTGWPIHCFLNEPSGWAPSHHAFIVPRKGWRLDVGGFRATAEHNNHWIASKTNEHKKFSYATIHRSWKGAANWFDESEDEIVNRAQEIAPLLISLAVEAAKADSNGQLKTCKIPGRACPK